MPVKWKGWKCHQKEWMQRYYSSLIFNLCTPFLCILFQMAVAHEYGYHLSGGNLQHGGSPTLCRGDPGPLTYSVSASSRTKPRLSSDMKTLQHVPSGNSCIQCDIVALAQGRCLQGLFFPPLMLMFKYSCCQHSTNVCESCIMSQVLLFHKTFWGVLPLQYCFLQACRSP